MRKVVLFSCLKTPNVFAVHTWAQCLSLKCGNGSGCKAATIAECGESARHSRNAAHREPCQCLHFGYQSVVEDTGCKIGH